LTKPLISMITIVYGSNLPYQPTIAAQLLGNGGKIEPYTIIIMLISFFGIESGCIRIRVSIFLRDVTKETSITTHQLINCICSKILMHG
jgi:hypothetical protein